MCRCKNEHSGGKRCPSDTSEARRVRNHNADAKKHTTLHTPITGPLTTNTPPTQPSQHYQPNGPAIKTVHALIEETKTLQTLILTPQQDIQPQTITLSTGTTITITNPTQATTHDQNGVLLEENNPHIILTRAAETHTTLIGQKINEIVQARTQQTDENIYTNETLKREEAEKIERKAKTKLTQHETLLQQKYGTSQEINQNASQEEKTTLEQLKQQWVTALKTAEEYNNEKGSQETQQKIQHQTQTLIETLQEIRPLGGTPITTKNSKKEATQILQEAIQIYPTEWIEASNKINPITIKSNITRSHYAHNLKTTTLKTVPKITTTLKPENWEPDPHNIQELGTWIKMDENNSWKNPHTGVTHSHYKQPNHHAWVQPTIETRRPNPENPDEKPRGAGWKKAEIYEETYNPLTHKTEKTGNLTPIWYRTKTTQIKTSKQTITSELTIPTYSPHPTAIHEFAHRIENTPRIGTYITKMEETFLIRRTTDPETGQREPLTRIYPRTQEYGRTDKFTNIYMGKEYTDNSREILSTGAEALFTQNFGSFLGTGRQKPDPDMKNFIIGLWASA